MLGGGGGGVALTPSLLKSYTSGPVIWKGCCAGQTHTDGEKKSGKGARTSLPRADCALELHFTQAQ